MIADAPPVTVAPHPSHAIPQAAIAPEAPVAGPIPNAELREFLIAADSITSLVAHREPLHDPENRDELVRISRLARNLCERLDDATDARGLMGEAITLEATERWVPSAAERALGFAVDLGVARQEPSHVVMDWAERFGLFMRTGVNPGTRELTDEERGIPPHD